MILTRFFPFSCFLLLRGINFSFQSSKIEKLGKLSHTSITKIRFLDSTPFLETEKKSLAFTFDFRGYNNYEKKSKFLTADNDCLQFCAGFFLLFASLGAAGNGRKEKFILTEFF